MHQHLCFEYSLIINNAEPLGARRPAPNDNGTLQRDFPVRRQLSNIHFDLPALVPKSAALIMRLSQIIPHLGILPARNRN